MQQSAQTLESSYSGRTISSQTPQQSQLVKTPANFLSWIMKSHEPPPPATAEQPHIYCNLPSVCHQPSAGEQTVFSNWNSDTHGARPVYQIILMVKWIRTSRSSIKNSLSLGAGLVEEGVNLEISGPHINLDILGAGLVGFGRVAREVAALGQAFGMQVHQIAFFTSLICTGTRRNPAACGTNQGT